MDEIRSFEHVVLDPEYRKKKATEIQITEKEKSQIASAFHSPAVFQLLSTLRSRRFGMGYRYETGEPEKFSWSHGKTVTQEKGPLAYKSEQQPLALSETEEAMLAWAACGPNGVVLADAPVHGNISTWLCWAGRTIPAPCNDVAVDLFVVNDQGTFLYRPSSERMSPLEIESEKDYWKILKWYREDRVKISDKRIDVGWMSGPEGTRVNMMGPWQYNVNRPGSTWFIPVGDLGFEWTNVLFSAYEWWHMYLTDPETGEPAGCKEWIKPGMLEMGVSIPSYDELLVLAHGHQVGCLVSNIRLACEALGLGAWVFCGFVDELILGGIPSIAKGLGFKYMERDANKNPNKVMTSIGLPGIKEACVAPSPQFPTAKDMCDYVCNIRYRRGSIFAREDNWALRNQAPYRPDVMKQLIEHPRTHIADWVREAVQATVEYIVDKYGCAPAFTNPIQAQFTAQVHHVDVDYYRKFYSFNGGKEPYAMTPQIFGHFKSYHKGEPDPYGR
jgi:hypothetical protein